MQPLLPLLTEIYLGHTVRIFGTSLNPLYALDDILQILQAPQTEYTFVHNLNTETGPTRAIDIKGLNRLIRKSSVAQRQ